MSRPEILSVEEIQILLPSLPDWRLENNALVCSIRFPDFLQAIEFVNAVAHLAERQDHHPEIVISYTEVTLRYWTHTAQGITSLDFKGAKEAERLIPLFKKTPTSLTQ
jgi:4a-hydroxytetrahydrobiopterin dehydratase